MVSPPLHVAEPINNAYNNFNDSDYAYDGSNVIKRQLPRNLIDNTDSRTAQSRENCNESAQSSRHARKSPNGDRNMKQQIPMSNNDYS